MSTYLRNNKGGDPGAVVDIATDVWDLDKQLELLLAWLHARPDFNFAEGQWIVDVGFSPRPNVTVAGYTVDVELMTLLSQNKITLWLSEYRQDS